MAPIYRVHCAVIFAIAQLSCCLCHKNLQYIPSIFLVLGQPLLVMCLLYFLFESSGFSSWPWLAEMLFYIEDPSGQFFQIAPIPHIGSGLNNVRRRARELCISLGVTDYWRLLLLLTFLLVYTFSFSSLLHLICYPWFPRLLLITTSNYLCCWISNRILELKPSSFDVLIFFSIIQG